MPIFDDVQRRKKLAETCMRKLLLTDLAEPSQIGNANLLNVADISEEPDNNETYAQSSRMMPYVLCWHLLPCAALRSIRPTCLICIFSATY